MIVLIALVAKLWSSILLSICCCCMVASYIVYIYAKHVWGEELHVRKLPQILLCLRITFNSRFFERLASYMGSDQEEVKKSSYSF